MVMKSTLTKPLNVKELLKEAELIDEREVIPPGESEPACTIRMYEINHRTPETEALRELQKPMKTGNVQK